jgi:hypothetical protein
MFFTSSKSLESGAKVSGNDLPITILSGHK